MATQTYTVLDSKLGDRAIAPANVLDLLNASAGPVAISLSGNVTAPVGNITSLGIEPAHPGGNVTATGTVQGNSTVLSTGINYLVGGNYTLPTPVLNAPVAVSNLSVSASVVWAAAGGGTINGGSANGNLSVAAGAGTVFWPNSALNYQSIPKVPS